MATKVFTPQLATIARPVRKTNKHKCFFETSPSRRTSPFLRQFTTTRTHQDEIATDGRQTPRWQRAPEKLTAPVLLRPPSDWKVNEDPERLDQVFRNFLGPNGHEMLTDEVKWLAVTHKSFDHGKRGYNDRLAFLGKKIVILQISLAMVNSPVSAPPPPTPGPYGREPFRHPALAGLHSLNWRSRHLTMNWENLSAIAEQCGLPGVMRWKPKKPSNLKGSGLRMIQMQSLFAIIGAIALQRGGEVANNVVRNKILTPLGVT